MGKTINNKMYFIQKLIKKLSCFFHILPQTILLYFLYIKTSYAYINPGIIGMFLQILVAIIAFFWLFFAKFKSLVKAFFRKLKKGKKDLNN